MASLKQKNYWLVYRDKLDREENHEGNQSTTYFTALTQMCREDCELKESWSRTEKVRAPT